MGRPSVYLCELCDRYYNQHVYFFIFLFIFLFVIAVFVIMVTL